MTIPILTLDKLPSVKKLSLCRNEQCFANDLFLDTIINVVFNGNGRSTSLQKQEKFCSSCDEQTLIYVPLLISPAVFDFCFLFRTLCGCLELSWTNSPICGSLYAKISYGQYAPQLRSRSQRHLCRRLHRNSWSLLLWIPQNFEFNSQIQWRS